MLGADGSFESNSLLDSTIMGDDSGLDYDDIDLWAFSTASPGWKWTYASHSKRGAELFGDLSHTVLVRDKFELKFNPVSDLLLEKAKLEIKSTLDQVHEKVFVKDRSINVRYLELVTESKDAGLLKWPT